MEASHPRFALILLFFCLFSIHHASSHALPANPQVPAVQPLRQLRDAAAIDRTVGNLISALAANPNIRYREAALLRVSFTVDRAEDDYLEDADRTLSSNIGDFRDILCQFRYGGPPPQNPDDTNTFIVKNRFPDHWDQWSPPQDSPWRTLNVPIKWDHVTPRMGIGRADALLKASGHRGRYARVTLGKMNSPHHPPVAWCFHGVKKSWLGGRTNFEVDALTGQILQAAWCG